MAIEQQAEGIQSITSRYSVSETVERLKSLLESKGAKIFTVIDHSGEAEKAGLAMPDTKLIVFGNPKAGTAVMLAAPLSAIDLPLKLLVWQDTGGSVCVSYTRPEFLQQRYKLPAEVMAPLAAVPSLAAAAGQ
jgi:uncharacterized protein (DUF302 family)